MKIAVSTDERTPLVDIILAELERRGHQVVYFGPEAGAEADWPEVTLQAAEQVAQGEADEAIVLCWTGTGASLIANKVPGIRAALCADAETARGARTWNHANVLGLSLRTTSETGAKEILDAWFATPYSADAWNRRQIERVRAIEEKYSHPRNERRARRPAEAPGEAPVRHPPRREIPDVGQESVWDYPRPPRLEDTHKHIQVIFNGVIIADTRRARRVLETSHPPVYYIPPGDVQLQYCRRTSRTSVCEWKGQAAYYTIQVGDQVAHNAAWFYPLPSPAYANIQDYIAFYPHLMELCLVDGERVTPQPGPFYGGWITHDIVGPFKGAPDSMGW